MLGRNSGQVILALALLFVYLGHQPVQAAPQTPPVYINGKFRLVELARSQRAVLSYDLRSIGGQHLTVDCYSQDARLGDPALASWRFDGSHGEVRLSFNEFPLAVYTLRAYASDANGNPLALPAPLIHVEYGGWRAWEQFQPPVEKVEETPDGFPRVEVAIDRRNRDVGISIHPMASVLRPGEEVLLQAAFRNLEPERLTWTLDGEGTLEMVDENTYRYRAPAELGQPKMFRVRAQSVSSPDLQTGASILVTDFDQDDILR